MYLPLIAIDWAIAINIVLTAIGKLVIDLAIAKAIKNANPKD